MTAKFPVTELPERSEEDRLNTSRIRTFGHLENAGAEWVWGVFTVPASVQNRIKKVGDAVHYTLQFTDEESVEGALRKWVDTEFANRPFESLKREDFGKMVEKLLELGATDRRKIERRIPQSKGGGAGFLGYASYGEYVRFSVPIVMEGVRAKKNGLHEKFDDPKNALFFDKTLD